VSAPVLFVVKIVNIVPRAIRVILGVSERRFSNSLGVETETVQLLAGVTRRARATFDSIAEEAQNYLANSLSFTSKGNCFRY